jgi:hypothetical protein
LAGGCLIITQVFVFPVTDAYLAFTSPNHLSIMNCCANQLPSRRSDEYLPQDKSKSQVVAYVAFAGSVIFTLAAASALVTSDLPLPLFG